MGSGSKCPRRPHYTLLFPTSSRTFSEFNAGNTILFQITVFDRKINETPLAM